MHQSEENESIHLHGYVDVDWVGDVELQKSTSCYVFQVGSFVVSWSSKRQSLVALSLTEAQYIALSRARQEAIRLRLLLKNIGFTQEKTAIIFEDN